MDLHPDWKEFCEAFNRNSVEYLIVGAFAVAHHGLPRLTGDIDFWIRPSAENAQRVSRALSEFGFEQSSSQVDAFAEPKRLWQIGRIPFRIDVLTSIDGLEFEEAWQDRVTGDLGGIAVNFPSRDDLLRNKAASGRPKDLSANGGGSPTPHE